MASNEYLSIHANVKRVCDHHLQTLEIAVKISLIRI